MTQGLRRITAVLLLLCLLPGFLTLLHGADAADVNNATVRVLLSSGGASEVSVSLAGRYAVGNTALNGGTVTAKLEDGTITVAHSSEGTLATAKTSVRLQRVGTDDSTVLTFVNAKHGKRVYFGDFVFYNDNGTLRVVNYVDLHHYLYGVVSGEMSDSAKPDVLKVETIAAKGFALAEVEARTSKYFDVYDTTSSQLYYGYIASETNTIAAVDAVWTQTLRYEGRIVKTYYSTADGGQILTPYIHWGGKTNAGAYYFGYDPFDLAGSSKNVVITLNGASPKSMNSALYAYLCERAGSDVREIVSIDALSGLYDPEHPNGTERYPKDLAPQARYDWTLTVQTTDGTNRTAAFSTTPDEIKALVAVNATGTVCFVVQTAQSEWKLVWGVPSGHRAGMSHRGATQMVKQGYSYVDVLKFYYRGATLYDETGRAIESTATFSFTYTGGGQTPVEPSPTQGTYQKDVIVTTDALNLREGPSTGTTSLQKLPLGTILGVYGSSGDWLYVQEPGGVYGYVHGSYVSDYQQTPIAHREGVCNADDSNLRTGPSTNFTKLYAINKGDPLYVYYRSGNWYYVMDRSTGQTAFLYKSYVTLGNELTGWQKIGKLWYYYSAEGVMQTGWQKIDGIWYYLDASGAMATGWQKIDGVWYFFRPGGAMVSGWQKIGNRWYYFRPGGAMVTGWQKIGGKWYYFAGSGAMQTGWQKVGGKWYYLNSSGDMHTSWLLWHDKWYYLESSGAMATGERTIGDRTYTFDSSGACLNP